MARNKYPEETIKLILDTAERLFMEKGYEKATLQDIIDETGLSKGAIYHHFSSKEDILQEICGRAGRETECRLSKVRDDASLNGCEKLKRIFRAAIVSRGNHTVMNMHPCLLENPRFLALQIKETFEEVAPHYIKPILEEGIADGSIQAEYPKALAEAILVLTNVWLNPLLLATDEQEMRARCQVFAKIMQGLGIEIMDEEMQEAYISYAKIVK